MKRLIWGFMAVLSIGLGGCRKDEDPQPSLPDYLTMPSSLTNYKGSGQITIQGDLSLQAQGPERQQGGTYSGVSGSISGGDLILVQSTFNQAVSYSDRLSIPLENRSYAELSIMNTLAAGSYPLGVKMQPLANGQITDLTINLPGPQVYISEEGSLTVDESTVLRTEGRSSLYRVRGSFDTNLLGGPKTLHVTGTFDVLLVTN